LALGPHPPTPKPQSPIPNPHIKYFINFYKLKELKYARYIYKKLK